MIKLPVDPCPCTPSLAYAACCGRFHAGETAPTAQQLMRSRYSAYVRGLLDYVFDTWHPSSRPPRDSLQEPVPRAWVGLQVRHAHDADSDHATVEFIARYKINGRGHRMHEISRFVRENGRWFYLDGDVD